MNSAEYIERKYSGISRHDLRRHVCFCSRARAADSSAVVVLSNSGRIPIWKRKFKTKPDCRELQISAGHVGRTVVEKAAAELERKGIQFKRKFTQKRRALSRIITSHEIDDVFTPKVIADIIVSVSALIDPDDKKFSMEYLCSFEEGCAVEDGDPVTFDVAYKLGHSIGQVAGVVARLFK
jgi:hypothetical protein